MLRPEDSQFKRHGANTVRSGRCPCSPTTGDGGLQVNISKEGSVEDVGVISSHPLLVQAAIDAVKQWQ